MHSMNQDWRNRNNINMFDPRRYNMESYYTSAQKKEMKHSFGDELLSNLHLLPDPLKKNLADSIITSESIALKSESKRTDKQFLNTVLEPEPPKMETSTNQSHIQAPFGGISNFISGVFNVISGAMMNWRPKSPAQYYDCFDDGATQGPPLSWHGSNNEVQNKSARENDLKSKSEMNIDCKTAVAQCEDKLNKVRLLLTTKSIEKPKLRPRRPRKAFVEAGSVEERFEDAFAPEDFVNVSSDTCIEYYSPYKIHDEVLSETAAPKIKIEQIVYENVDIIKTMPEDTVKCEESKQLDTTMVKDTTETKLDINTLVEDTIETKSDVKIEENEVGKTKEELVSSCEDKLTKLKALLQEKRKKNTHTMPSADSNTEPVGKSNEIHTKPPKPHDKTKDKRFKNPCRTINKRMKTRMRKSIQDDLLFAQELNCDDLSSAENSPSINRLSDTANPLKKVADTNNSPNNVEYFDEVSGRFRSTSTTESEDSFQIVFNDSPKQNRMRRVSDCDSEDSFIVFEDSPDSCYTSNDVFGDTDESGSEYADSDSDLSDTDDIQVTKLSHSLSRTLSDLTDGSLYEDNAFDEVDCAVRSVCDEISSQDIAECVPEVYVEPKSTGLLLNEEKKLLKRQQPPKSVHFSPHPPKVHVMRVWTFAARQARAGHWERCALDRDRFKRRIADVDMAVSWVLKPQHRSRVMFQRFMPWWNAQRRKEIAEKKEREARLKEEQKIEAERLEMEKLEQESKVDNESDVIVNDKEQEQINDVINNDSNNVIDKEQKQIDDVISNETVIENEKKINDIKSKELKNKEMKKFNEHKNNDLKNMIKGKLNGLKSNGCVRNKSQLNDVKKIEQVSDNNDFTTKLRSEGLSST